MGCWRRASPQTKSQLKMQTSEKPKSMEEETATCNQPMQIALRVFSRATLALERAKQ